MGVSPVISCGEFTEPEQVLGDQEDDWDKHNEKRGKYMEEGQGEHGL